jgi:hypothetical protein
MHEDDPIVSAMMTILFASMAIVVLAPTLQRIFSGAATQLYAAQAYRGLVDFRDLGADQTTRWLDLVGDPPYTPWIALSAFNDGPDTLYLGINRPSGWIRLEKGGSQNADFSMAERRIEIVFYRADGRASFRIEGKY